MKISRVWAMPDRWTFKIPPIASLITNYVGSGEGWIDPFAGKHSPAEFTNDINPEMPTAYHLKANDFLNQLEDSKYKGVLFDPPYNLAQFKECYQSIGVQLMKDDVNYTYSKPKDIAQYKIMLDGYAICFGWNTVGFGVNRGFKLIEILLVCHGGHHNDTIVTVEQVVSGKLTQEVMEF